MNACGLVEGNFISFEVSGFPGVPSIPQGGTGAMAMAIAASS